MIDFNYNPDDPTGPRKSKFWRLRDSARCQPQPWRWPLQRIDDRVPLVLPARLAEPQHGAHLGYEPRPHDHELQVPVYAAQDGEVMFAGETKSGFAITIDHRAHGWATGYAQLSQMSVAPNYTHRDRKRQRVCAGDVIGYAAKSPIEIRFALWKWADAGGFVAVDPLPKLGEWSKALAFSTSIPTKQAA